MKNLQKRKGGFTLIELMIVVAIIGILAAIAIPNFLTFQLKAKTSEGKTNLAAIRTAQEGNFAEFGAYIAATASPIGTAISVNKATFNDTGAVGANFATIGWVPEGRVYFNYAVALTGTTSFTASAMADIDGDGFAQTWGYVKDVANAGATGAAHTVGNNPVCTIATMPMLDTTVMRCAATYGQSVF